MNLSPGVGPEEVHAEIEAESCCDLQGTGGPLPSMLISTPRAFSGESHSPWQVAETKSYYPNYRVDNAAVERPGLSIPPMLSLTCASLRTRSVPTGSLRDLQNKPCISKPI